MDPTECAAGSRYTSKKRQVKRACTHCRRRKVACDDERPCRQCVRSKFTDCQDAPDRRLQGKRKRKAEEGQGGRPRKRRMHGRRLRTPQHHLLLQNGGSNDRAAAVDVENDESFYLSLIELLADSDGDGDNLTCEQPQHYAMNGSVSESGYFLPANEWFLSQDLVTTKLPEQRVISLALALRNNPPRPINNSSAVGTVRQ